MKKVLAKCTIDDFEIISEMLDSYVSFTNDRKRKRLIDSVKEDPERRGELILLLDKQIRYFGSSDAAYVKRKVLSKDGGIPSSRLLDDVSRKLRVPVKVGSFEARLEALATSTFEKEMSSKTPEEIREYFQSAGVGIRQTDLIEKRMKKDGAAAMLPIILEILGPKIVLGLIEASVVSAIAGIIGREAAKQIVKEVMKRNPIINALGPLIWIGSGAWLAYDLQGPAYRKTIPLVLYLGIVALRDGSEPVSRRRRVASTRRPGRKKVSV